MSKIWIMSVGIDKRGAHEDRRKELDSAKKHSGWSVRKTVEPNDLILFYYTKPHGAIKSIFKVTSTAKLEGAGEWTKQKSDYFADIERITENIHIDPITYEEIMANVSLKGSQFVKMNMFGRSEVKLEYWTTLYNLIIRGNPELKENLSKYNHK